MADLLPLTGAAATAFVALILARAAWHKAQAFPETVGFATGYGLVAADRVPAILRGLIAAEVLATAALVLPATRMAGGLLAAGLFLGYGALMATALAAGRREIECGCGGAPQVVSGLTLSRNALLAGVALAAALAPAGSVGPAGAVVALAAALTLLALYGIAEGLAAHLPHIRRV